MLVATPSYLEGEKSMCTAKNFNKKIDKETIKTISKFIDRPFFSDPKKVASPRPGSLDHALINKHKSFHDLLWYHARRLNLSNAQIYSRVYMDRRFFSKITKDGHHPTKDTAIVLAIALKLTYSEAVEFLATAGYSFSPSYNPDILIAFFIKHENHNILDINQSLLERGLKPIAMSEEKFHSIKNKTYIKK